MDRLAGDEILPTDNPLGEVPKPDIYITVILVLRDVFQLRLQGRTKIYSN